MTSSTDAKNQTTYYEYDGLQRLMNIKDQYGNILKHMDYHYQGQ
jgi:YD repeat-containing protein